MNLLEKYFQGNTIQVYQEIERMSQNAFENDILPEVEAVLTETMRRVSYNLDLIYRALVDEKYCFKRSPRYDFEYPLLRPKSGVQDSILKLDGTVEGIGYVPLSLKFFYTIVGSCNFAWDYDSKEEIPWEGADPIQINPIDDVLSEAGQIEFDDQQPGLQISADYYHKDNISGGPPYSVELTETPQVDSRLLDEEHGTTFIGYLRMAMENCGFTRAYAVSDLPDFLNFCNRVKPLIKPI
jgi:hypothetical protein